jgi:8-oxo-dGTP diphosphatase
MFTGLVTYGLKRFIYTIPKLCILPNHKKGIALVLYPMSTKKSAQNTSNAQVNDAVQLVVSYPKVPLTVDCVIFGFEENKLKVLLIKSDLAIYKGKFSLLGDMVKDNEELDDAAYRVLQERTGMKDVYLDQVKTFGHPTRHPGGRVITVAYCSLLNINHHALAITANELHWHSVEDLQEMAFDHKEIVDACHAWLQKRIQEHPLGFNLLPEKFSLRELQNLYEAISGLTLDRRNFRKKFASMKLLIDINEIEQDVPHRPGKLYKFDFKKYEQSKRKWVGIDF